MKFSVFVEIINAINIFNDVFDDEILKKRKLKRLNILKHIKCLIVG